MPITSGVKSTNARIEIIRPKVGGDPQMKANSEVAQKVHRFSLLYADAFDLPEDYDEILFEAGCDDATVLTRDGLLIIDFAREAPTFRDALLSAIEGIEGSSLPVSLVRVEPID
jgi:hypothetical protein